MNQAIVTLSGLSAAEVALLAQGGVNNQNELMTLTFEDIGLILPNATVLVHPTWRVTCQVGMTSPVLLPCRKSCWL
jgi:hypothetical protein